MIPPLNKAHGRKTWLQEFISALRQHLYKAKLICYSLVGIVGATQIIIRKQFPEVHPPWAVIGTVLVIVLFTILLVPPVITATRSWKRSD